MSVKEETRTALPEKADKPRKKSKKKWIRNGIIIVLVLAILGGVLAFMSRDEEEVAATVIFAQAVTRGDVTNYLSGSGMIAAMDSYDIVAMVQGDILSSPFEEGQIVNKDDILYTFDSEDARQSLQSQQNNYDSQKISYESEQKKWEKFTVKAPVSGYVKGIDSKLRVGDEISSGTVLAIVNNSTVEVTIPFAAAAADSIFVGSAAQLSSSKYMTNNIYGTVTEVDGVYAGSFNVTVAFANPGQIEEGDVLGAAIGGMQSTGTGSCRVANEVEAEIKGEIASINVKNGDYVTAGTVMFTLDDEDTKNSLRQSQINFENSGISLQKAYDALDNYTIKSPITGTVIQKNYKAGDTLGNSSNSAVLATIADISKMKFTINVDELDISGVALGQKVEVTADAITGKVFEGEVTKIIQQGTGTSGVTTYPVEITIAEPGELKIGMNVTGTVMMSSAKNVMKVPLEAVSMRGGETYVQVLKEEVRQRVFGDATVEDTAVPTPAQRPQSGMPQRAELPENAAQQSVPAPQAQDSAAEKEEYTFTDDDFEMRKVTTGVSSDEEIEIVSGLSVGEYVKVVQVMNNRANNGFGGFGGMSGMSGMRGGMPSGGMSGGMPSGGAAMRGGSFGGMQGGR